MTIQEMQDRIDAVTNEMATQLSEMYFYGRTYTPRERFILRLEHFRARSGYAAWIDKPK